MATNVIGMFRNRAAANAAVDELLSSGFARSDVSIIASDQSGEFKRYTTNEQGDNVEEGAMKGAGTGAALGGIVGLIAGIGAIALPGIGVVAGPIAGLLGGAAIGAVGGGIVGALMGMGVPEDEAKEYERRLKSGETLVAVHTSEAMASKAHEIMDRNEASDVDEQSGTTSVGSTGMQPRVNDTATPRSLSGEARVVDNVGEERIELAKEELAVGKREVERGGVRVRSYVTEQPVTEQIQLREEHVNVERRPVDRPATAGAFDTFQEGTIEMRETAEVPVVSKEARVVEEVVVSKSADTRTETVSETLRETHVDVEPLEEFRRNFETQYASTGASWEEYSPAYTYGYQASNDGRYAGKDWSVIENDIRTDWEQQHPGTWDRYRNAIQNSWTSGQNRSNKARLI